MATCSACGKNESGYNCTACGVPLCAECTKQAYIQETGPWCMSVGVPVSQIWAGEKYVKVCPKCYQEAELL